KKGCYLRRLPRRQGQQYGGTVPETGGSELALPVPAARGLQDRKRSEEHTSELQSRFDLVCRLLLEKKKTNRCTCPDTLRAARPMVCVSEMRERRKPAVTAASIATRDHWGRSSPRRSGRRPNSSLHG